MKITQITLKNGNKFEIIRGRIIDDRDITCETLVIKKISNNEEFKIRLGATYQYLHRMQIENSSFDKKFMKSLKDVSIKKLYYGEYKVVEDARFGEKMKRKTMGITRLPIYKYVDGEIINTYSTWKRFKGE